MLVFSLPLGAMIFAGEGEDSATSANQTVEAASFANELAGLLPDVGKICRKAVTYPLEKAEGDITDPDILEFYQGYLRETGLAEE